MQLISSIDFPDPHTHMPEGIIAVGGKLDTGTLYHAYARGIFPWPQEGYPLLWFSPEKRGILDFSKLHIPRSLRKFLNQQTDWDITINKDFRGVIEGCARASRPGQEGTWILPAMKKAYLEFHEAGFAHSIEVRENNILIGGLYGVWVRGLFSAESMFFKKSNASKVALLALISHLQSQGVEWIDIQMVTPITEAFGGEYLTRNEFLKKLRDLQIQKGYDPLF
ncbi:MAG: leucyl/phenylalanyl-tRNA--protein transferase [Bdellovibrionia bacterium]